VTNGHFKKILIVEFLDNPASLLHFVAVANPIEVKGRVYW
jgi:hypothetical protein